MRAMPPHIDVPGDNAEERELPGGGTVRPNVMQRSGTCLGMTPALAVWRFGFKAGSESANAYGVQLDADVRGFVWVLATRKTGHVRETLWGYAVDLPANFTRVIES